jgi:hypothetical protein
MLRGIGGTEMTNNTPRQCNDVRCDGGLLWGLAFTSSAIIQQAEEARPCYPFRVCDCPTCTLKRFDRADVMLCVWSQSASIHPRPIMIVIVKMLHRQP